MNLAWADSFVWVRGMDGVPPPKSFTELAKVSLLVGYDEPILQKDKSIMECGVAWD